MRKKVVANKLKEWLMDERRNAAIEFIQWLDEKYHILPGGIDLPQLYADFLRLDPYSYKKFKEKMNGTPINDTEKR